MSELSVRFLPLAQVAKKATEQDMESATRTLLLWFVVVVVVLLFAGIALYVFRSRALRDKTRGAAWPLTLAQVREMHERGEIDDDEMRKLKEVVTTRAQRALEKTPPKEQE